MLNGWIKLHRKFIEWEWYADLPVKILFLHLLLKVNHKDKQWRGMLIKKGSCITSYSKMAKQSHLTLKQVRTSLNKLKETGEVAHTATSKFSLIKLNNYDKYQAGGTPKGSQRAHRGHTEGTPRATNKNDKNVKNGKNMIASDNARGQKLPFKETNGKEISSLISAFQKSVNPTLKFQNMTQRKACARLIKEFGFPAVLNTVKACISVQGQQYAPTITTPYALERKLGDLMVFLKRQKSGRRIVKI
jgi:hypothetical protein